MIAFQSGSSAVQHATSISISRPKPANQINGSNKQIKDYVVTITFVVFLQYLCCKLQVTNQQPSVSASAPDSIISTNQTTIMDNRLNIGREVRELRLGSTFSPQNSQTAFHTLKYDFKPASVDLSKVATLDVSSNNQVTVTVPNLESSGVPHTVFKGNQKKYTRECIIIFDRKTGGMTLEKLNHNIQVKKTRSEPTHKAIPPPQPPKLENNTQRTSSKTRVSTGVRKNAIIGFLPRSSPMQQGSPSYPLHKSPQSAPAWNANNGQSTLPSIPIIGMDDDIDMMPNSGGPMTTSSSMPSVNNDFQQPQQHQQQQQQQQLQHQQQQQQQYHHQNQSSIHHHNNIPSGNVPSSNVSNSGSNMNLDNEVGVLSSSDSSSDTESSGSGSDSEDSDNPPQKNNVHVSSQQSLSQHHQPFQNGSLPGILHDDLQLSESNSSDSD